MGRFQLIVFCSAKGRAWLKGAQTMSDVRPQTDFCPEIFCHALCLAPDQAPCHAPCEAPCERFRSQHPASSSSAQTPSPPLAHCNQNTKDEGSPPRNLPPEPPEQCDPPEGPVDLHTSHRPHHLSPTLETSCPLKSTAVWARRFGCSVSSAPE